VEKSNSQDLEIEKEEIGKEEKEEEELRISPPPAISLTEEKISTQLQDGGVEESKGEVVNETPKKRGRPRRGFVPPTSTSTSSASIKKTKKKETKPTSTTTTMKLKKKKKKDPNRPKRAKNSYMLFVEKHRPKVVEDNPKMKVTEVLKRMGEMWREVTDEEKEELQAVAEEDKKRYALDMANYTPPPDLEEEEPNKKKSMKGNKKKKRKRSKEGAEEDQWEKEMDRQETEKARKNKKKRLADEERLRGVMRNVTSQDGLLDTPFDLKFTEMVERQMDGVPEEKFEENDEIIFIVRGYEEYLAQSMSKIPDLTSEMKEKVVEVTSNPIIASETHPISTIRGTIKQVDTHTSENTKVCCFSWFFMGFLK